MLSTNDTGFQLSGKGGVELEGTLIYTLIELMLHIFQFGSEWQAWKFCHKTCSSELVSLRQSTKFRIYGCDGVVVLSIDTNRE